MLYYEGTTGELVTGVRRSGPKLFSESRLVPRQTPDDRYRASSER
jgi:hypothetical protein